MTDNRIENRHKRLGEINDRKIAIILEFGLINRRIEELRSEYSRLDREYYELCFEPPSKIAAWKKNRRNH